MKRKLWTPEEDAHVFHHTIAYQNAHGKIKWSLIVEQLKQAVTGWQRNSKQCRQRWLNHLRPNVTPNHNQEDFSQEEFQQLLSLMRIFHKRWCLISRHMLRRSDSSLKNYFYASIRKGIRYLNFYNSELRHKKLYRVLKMDLVKKLLLINDDRRTENLQIIDEQAFTLSERIRENLLRSSRMDIEQPNARAQANFDPAFYEKLNEDIARFCKICRFKKAKSARGQQQAKDYQFTKPRGHSDPVAEKKKSSRLIRAKPKAKQDHQPATASPKCEVKIQHNSPSLQQPYVLGIFYLYPPTYKVQEQTIHVKPNDVKFQ